MKIKTIVKVAAVVVVAAGAAMAVSETVKTFKTVEEQPLVTPTVSKVVKGLCVVKLAAFLIAAFWCLRNIGLKGENETLWTVVRNLKKQYWELASAYTGVVGSEYDINEALIKMGINHD